MKMLLHCFWALLASDEVYIWAKQGMTQTAGVDERDEMIRTWWLKIRVTSLCFPGPLGTFFPVHVIFIFPQVSFFFFFFLTHMTSHLTSSSRVLACFCPGSSGASCSWLCRVQPRASLDIWGAACRGGWGRGEVTWLWRGGTIRQTRRSQLHY